MQRRFTVPVISILILLLAMLGYTDPDATAFTPLQLLVKACGGKSVGVDSPPELIPELRAAAANAVAEMTTDARSQGVPLAIDTATTWEAIARNGPNPECRAIGESVLPQIYLSSSRSDNPFADSTAGLQELIASVVSPAQAEAVELTRARVKSLVIVCRDQLFAGTATSVVERLEVISNGGTEQLDCRNQSFLLSGSNEAVREVISDSLKGAYISQIGPISLAPEYRDGANDRALKVCKELEQRFTDGNLTGEYRLAAAAAYFVGNINASLPPEFSYGCVSESNLQDLRMLNEELAPAGIALSAKSLAKSNKLDAELVTLAEGAALRHEQLAAALALGIRWAPNAFIDVQTGNVMINEEDALAAVTQQTGRPIASAYIFPIGQVWANQSMDTAGHCIQVGGVSDCILTRLPNLAAPSATTSQRIISEIDLSQMTEPTNFKVITDREIGEYVLLNESSLGLDLNPLSNVSAGGIFRIGAVGGFTTRVPINHTGPPFRESEMVFDRLLETGFLRTYEPALAEHFEVSPDLQQVLFRLRAGVRWNDGVLFDATDVTFSMGAVFHCILAQSGSGSDQLVPFFNLATTSNESTDGTCKGSPAILNNTQFISPGPNGVIDSTPEGNDTIFGNRILPAAAPLALGLPGNNVIFRGSIETSPLGDDSLVDVAENEIVVIWQEPKSVPQQIGLDEAACCYPRHKLLGALDESITSGDPSILLDRWSRSKLIESPEDYVGTGPFRLVKIDDAYVFERNPYYWKTDELGGRLPKLDFIQVTIYDSRDAYFSAYLSGQLDQFTPNRSEITLLHASAEERNVELFLGDTPLPIGYELISLNGDVHLADPNKEALGIAFRNPEVRRAISQSYDRRSEAEEYFVGEQFQTYAPPRFNSVDIASPTCDISFNYSELAVFCDAYQILEDEVSFDIDSANARFESLGILDRNNDGIREISAGFGFIVPGPNGVLDSVPAGDDFIMAGFKYSGLGHSDRDGDGDLDDDPGIIQPGRNGVLDTAPSGDDYAHRTSISGDLNFQIISSRIDFSGMSRASGIGFSTKIVSQSEFATKIRVKPESYEAARTRLLLPFLVPQLRFLWGTCAFSHIHRNSDCTNPESREPYQVRIDEMSQIASQATDDLTRARLHAELQLLITANVPFIPLLNERDRGSVRQDLTNAPVGIFDISVRYFDILYLLENQ